jgi:hypothetical protein
MATQPQPDPQQAGGAGDASSGASPQQPSQAPANPKQILLAQMYQMCKKLAQEDPTLSAGMQKAAQGIQEAQTALVTEAKPQPTSSNPAY